MWSPFDLKPSLEEQFHRVKLRGFTVQGSEEKVENGVFQRRNVFESINAKKSEKLRKAWTAKEATRWKKKSMKKVKKRQKRKLKQESKVPSKKMKPAPVDLNRGAVVVVGEEMANDNGTVVSGDKQADADALPSEISRPLRGGQISLANRKEKPIQFLKELKK